MKGGAVFARKKVNKTVRGANEKREEEDLRGRGCLRAWLRSGGENRGGIVRNERKGRERAASSPVEPRAEQRLLERQRPA